MAIQIYISLGIYILCDAYFQMVDSITDCLIDIGALLTINEIDNIIGEFFILHLKTYYSDLVDDQSFLKFDIDKNQTKVAYQWCIVFSFGLIILE